jgi:hypothetical protein
MSRMRTLAVGALAGIALASLAFFQLGAAEPNRPETTSPPLGQRVVVAHTGAGSQLTGRLVAQDADWLMVEVGEYKFWVSRRQVVYIQHPAPTDPPPIPAPSTPR